MRTCPSLFPIFARIGPSRDTSENVDLSSEPREMFNASMSITNSHSRVSSVRFPTVK